MRAQACKFGGLQQKNLSTYMCLKWWSFVSKLVCTSLLLAFKFKSKFELLLTCLRSTTMFTFLEQLSMLDCWNHSPLHRDSASVEQDNCIPNRYSKTNKDGILEACCNLYNYWGMLWNSRLGLKINPKKGGTKASSIWGACKDPDSFSLAPQTCKLASLSSSSMYTIKLLSKTQKQKEKKVGRRKAPNTISDICICLGQLAGTHSLPPHKPSYHQRQKCCQADENNCHKWHIVCRFLLMTAC